MSVSRDSKLTKAVQRSGFPQTMKQMKSFLGATNFYRRYIRGYGNVARPLQDMTKKESGVDWDGPHEIIPTDEQEESFETLKKYLTNQPILTLPMRNRPYIIDCYASQYAIGVVLLQQQNPEEPK